MHFVLVNELDVKACVPKNCWRYEQQSYHATCTCKVSYRNNNKTYIRSYKTLWDLL